MSPGRVVRVAIPLYAISFIGFAVGILEKSDALWAAWLIYAAAGLFFAAVLVTLFAISLIGDRPRR